MIPENGQPALPSLNGSRIHALWCHPRSMSTAVERVMRERGDLDVLHEPFMYYFYIGKKNRQFADFTPDQDHPVSYDDIRARIRKLSLQNHVFFKDMAYYVRDELAVDTVFSTEMSHAFLIRDPAESILSYQRRDPHLTSEEVGIESQWQLYSHLVDVGLQPHIMFADDIRRDPYGELRKYWLGIGLPDCPAALTWDSQVPADWQSVQQWHHEAIVSGSIRPANAEQDTQALLAALEALGQPYIDYHVHHQPFYAAFQDAARAIRSR